MYNKILYFIVETTTLLEQTSTGPTTMSLTSISNQSNSLETENFLLNVIFDVDCVLASITLIPSTSSLLSPMQFRRNQDFYISSYIELKCNTSLSITTQWTIYNCTSLNCFSQIPIDQTVERTFSELYIPARTLPYGVYELKLTISMKNSLNMFSSSSAYVKITPSGITANLVQYGTSMITRGYEQDLILDPGTYSVDLDESIFNATVSDDDD